MAIVDIAHCAFGSPQSRVEYTIKLLVHNSVSFTNTKAIKQGLVDCKDVINLTRDPYGSYGRLQPPASLCILFFRRTNRKKRTYITYIKYLIVI